MENLTRIKNELIAKIREKLNLISNKIESNEVTDKQHEIFLLVTVNEELEDVLLNWSNNDPNSTLNYFRNRKEDLDDEDFEDY
jgi:hypothetical protein